jgi:hypothetical protein
MAKKIDWQLFKSTNAASYYKARLENGGYRYKVKRKGSDNEYFDDYEKFRNRQTEKS